MNDKVFIDTNIFVYAYLKNPKKEEDFTKHLKAQKLLRSFSVHESVVISTQVCNKYYSTLLKNKIENQDIQHSLKNLMKKVEVSAIQESSVYKAFEIKNRYNFSYWDSLILSSALENECTIIYSEDMHNSQQIESTLKIVNPFL